MMRIPAARELALKPYRAYTSFKRAVRDYSGSLVVNHYSHFPKTVRRYRDDDLEPVLDIYEKCFGNTEYHQILKYSKQFRNIFYVYEINGVVVGYLGFYVHLHREGVSLVQKATLFSGAVEESMRNTGIFTSSYRECLAALQRNGVKAAYAYVNVNNSGSLAVHDKLGFNRICRINRLYGAEDGYKVELKLRED